MKTLGEVFNPYLADKPLADDISSAELLKLNINSNNPLNHNDCQIWRSCVEG